jgi:hypothetical protein
MVHDRSNKLDRRIFECDDDDLDESGLLRDGRSLRIRVADDQTVEDENYVTDAFGNPAGHRPGYVFAGDGDDAAERRVDDAYAAHDAWLQNAWRSPGSGARVAPALGTRVAAGRTRSTRRTANTRIS